MAKQIKKFSEGGAYEGDDPIVKYRMGMIDDKGNDIPKKSSNPTVEPTIKTETKQGEHAKIDAATRLKAVQQNAPRYISKGLSPKSINPDRLVRKDILNQFPNSKSGVVRSIPLESYEYDDSGYKSGGKVKSASARADGCAIRGKTRA
jgi:hypothetical protein